MERMKAQDLENRLIESPSKIKSQQSPIINPTRKI